MPVAIVVLQPPIWETAHAKPQAQARNKRARTRRESHARNTKQRAGSLQCGGGVCNGGDGGGGRFDVLIVGLSLVGLLGAVGQYFQLVLLLRCCRVVRLFGKVVRLRARPCTLFLFARMCVRV